MKFKALLVLFVGFLTSTFFCQAQSIWHPSYLTGASGLSNSKLERLRGRDNAPQRRLSEGSRRQSAAALCRSLQAQMQ